MRFPASLAAVVLGCGWVLLAGAASPGSHQAKLSESLDWDVAFADNNRSPALHFVAQYQDAHGAMHRLEEWRQGNEHLRRRTDDRIDLHADAIGRAKTGQPADYVWQIIDMEKKIDHRVSTQGMLRVGMLYNYWSMAHVLTRPAGRFEVRRVEGALPVRVAGLGCTWYQISPDGQPGSRVCWSPEIAAPLKMEAQGKDGGWTTSFVVQSIDRKPVPAGVFAVHTAGLQVRNVDELSTED